MAFISFLGVYPQYCGYRLIGSNKNSLRSTSFLFRILDLTFYHINIFLDI